MAISPIEIGSDMDIGYTGASNARSGAPFDAGTCTYSLKSSTGTVVGTGTLAYVAASNGDYYGTIESTVTVGLTEDAPYFLEITFASGTGYDDFRRIPLRAAYRTAA